MRRVRGGHLKSWTLVEVNGGDEVHMEENILDCASGQSLEVLVILWSHWNVSEQQWE